MFTDDHHRVIGIEWGVCGGLKGKISRFVISILIRLLIGNVFMGFWSFFLGVLELSRDLYTSTYSPKGPQLPPLDN